MTMELSVEQSPLSRSPTASDDPQSAMLVMRYEEFLAWSDEDVHAEWVPLDNSGRGEVIIHMPPKDIHQAVVGFLYKLLGLFVDLFDLGKLRIAPLEVKLQPGGSSREPDILFVAAEHLDRLTPDRLIGPPDLVIEVVSPTSVKRDRSAKYREYQAAGVREYWVIDPREAQRRADFFCLDDVTRGEGEYRLFATEEDERVASRVLPGFWLRPAWLWQVDDIDPLLIFCEIADLPGTVVGQFRERLRAGFGEPIPSET